MTYTVVVSNVVVSLQARLFTYTVTIIDPDVPSLAIQPAGTNTIALSWPATSTGYSLQENSSLPNTSGWTTVGTAFPIVNDHYVATVTNSLAQGCYRLRK